MIELRCVSCGRTYEKARERYLCEECGPLLGTLEVLYDYENMQFERPDFTSHGGMFQFGDLLPVKSHTPVDGAIGASPLIAFERLHGIKKLLIKHEGMNFSGSLKDRASIIALNMAIEDGYDTIYCASTGNAASSLALISAHSFLNTVIFIPQSTPLGKLAQINASGAEVVTVEGTYDEAFEKALKVGTARGWYCRNSAINPYLTEGKKTAAFEILIQNDYRVPDICFVSVGDGTVISALIKGFEEFRILGLVNRIPVVIGVQAEGAQTLKKVFEKGPPYDPLYEETMTVADSISVGNPRDVVKACKYLERTGGRMMSVSDGAIVRATYELATLTGVFAEPAAAAAYAGFKQCVDAGELSHESEVVVVVTGSGLKDPSLVLRGDV